MRIIKMKLQRSENPVDGDQGYEIYDDLFLQNRKIVLGMIQVWGIFLSFQ